MGLDMFLYRVPRAKTVQELTDLDEKINSSGNVGDALNEYADENKFIYSISAHYDKYDKKWSVIPAYHNAAYWRKFNALHKWFVDNVQGGVDDCDPYLVQKEHIESLLSVLESLTPENCADLFPAQSGFFFGNTDYEEWYWNDVRQTIHICHYLLSQVNWREESLVYKSSW